MIRDKRFYRLEKKDRSQWTLAEARWYLGFCDEMIAACHGPAWKSWVATRDEVAERFPEAARMVEEGGGVVGEEVTDGGGAEAASAPEVRTGKDTSRIMYIEHKVDGVVGPGRIGRVRFSRSGKSIYYGDLTLRSLKGGYKANYYDVRTGERYWVSGCKRRGEDTLYAGTVQIDEDVRQDYWRLVRGQPENVHLQSFRTAGKYAR